MSDQGAPVGENMAPEAQADPPVAATEPAGDAVAEPGGERAKLPREQRYRIERNEARAEVERLGATVEALQRAQVEALLGGLNPNVFWRSDVTLADLLAPNGTVDEVLVADAAHQARELFGIKAMQPVPELGRGVELPARTL